MVESNISNARVIASSVGWTIAASGLAILSCAVLFLIADSSAIAKQTILNLPNMISKGSFHSFLHSIQSLGISGQGLILVLITFILGFVLRMIGLTLSDDKFIQRLERCIYSRKGGRYEYGRVEVGDGDSVDGESVDGDDRE